MLRRLDQALDVCGFPYCSLLKIWSDGIPELHVIPRNQDIGFFLDFHEFQADFEVGNVALALFEQGERALPHGLCPGYVPKYFLTCFPPPSHTKKIAQSSYTLTPQQRRNRWPRPPRRPRLQHTHPRPPPRPPHFSNPHPPKQHTHNRLPNPAQLSLLGPSRCRNVLRYCNLPPIPHPPRSPTEYPLLLPLPLDRSPSPSRVGCVAIVLWRLHHPYHP